MKYFVKWCVALPGDSFYIKILQNTKGKFCLNFVVNFEKF